MEGDFSTGKKHFPIPGKPHPIRGEENPVAILPGAFAHRYSDGSTGLDTFLGTHIFLVDAGYDNRLFPGIAPERFAQFLIVQHLDERVADRAMPKLKAQQKWVRSDLTNGAHQQSRHIVNRKRLCRQGSNSEIGAIAPLTSALRSIMGGMALRVDFLIIHPMVMTAITATDADTFGINMPE